MGHVYETVELRLATSETVTMLVDTGATFTMISPELADRLGVGHPRAHHRLTLADGREIEAEAGTVTIRIGDREAFAVVVIAACNEPLLGVEALEALGLAVDPSSGTLTPTRAYTVRLGGGLRSPTTIP